MSDNVPDPSRTAVLSNLEAAFQVGVVVTARATGDTSNAKFEGLSLGPASEQYFVTANTTINTGNTWQDIGNEIILYGAKQATVVLDITMNGIHDAVLRAFLRRVPGGSDFIEQVYAPADLQTLKDREHVLNPDTSGRCYAVVNPTGFGFMQIQLQPNWTGGTAGVVNSTSFALLL